jgi:hypothetical protein
VYKVCNINMKNPKFNRNRKPTDVTVWYETDVTIGGEKTEWHIVANYQPLKNTAQYILDGGFTVHPREVDKPMIMNKANLRIQKIVERDAKSWIPSLFML